MLYDLVVILLIIGFSYLFKISITKKYDEQLIFILLALVIMVIYKYLVYRYINKSTPSPTNTEPYQDFTDEINDFLGQDIPSGINRSNINEYKSQLASLQDKVDIMNDYLKELNTRSTTNMDNQAAIGGLDFQAGQQIQDYRIKKIQQDIQRTSDLIKANKLAEDAKKYNKIKVFSSCVVSNADGSYSADSAMSGSTTMGQGGIANSTGSITGTTQTNLAGVPINGSGVALPHQASISGTGTNTPNLGTTLGAGSGVDINSVLNAIANQGIKVKLT